MLTRASGNRCSNLATAVGRNSERTKGLGQGRLRHEYSLSSYTQPAGGGNFTERKKVPEVDVGVGHDPYTIAKTYT